MCDVGNDVTIVNLREIVMAEALPVVLGKPYDDGETAKLFVPPISDGFDEAVRDVRDESRQALGLTAPMSTKEEIEELLASEPRKMMKMVGAVSRAKILHGVVTEAGEPFFASIDEVKRVGLKVRDKILEVIRAQERASGRLGESQPVGASDTPASTGPGN